MTRSLSRGTAAAAQRARIQVQNCAVISLQIHRDRTNEQSTPAPRAAQGSSIPEIRGKQDGPPPRDNAGAASGSRIAG